MSEQEPEPRREEAASRGRAASPGEASLRAGPAVRDVRAQPLGDGEAVIVSLSGDIDLHRSPAVRAELIRQANRRPERLVVDLTGVHYMDSSGVASLIEALQRIKKHKGDMVLVGPSERVLSIFQIARLDTIFRIVASRQEAMTP